MPSEFDYDRSISMAVEMARLRTALQKMQEEHLRMLGVITHALGGELRITEIDYSNAQGVSLSYGIDPQTGDLIYRTEKLPNG